VVGFSSFQQQLLRRFGLDRLRELGLRRLVQGFRPEYIGTGRE